MLNNRVKYEFHCLLSIRGLLSLLVFFDNIFFTEDQNKLEFLASILANSSILFSLILLSICLTIFLYFFLAVKNSCLLLRFYFSLTKQRLALLNCIFNASNTGFLTVFELLIFSGTSIFFVLKTILQHHERCQIKCSRQHLDLYICGSQNL